MDLGKYGKKVKNFHGKHHSHYHHQPRYPVRSSINWKAVFIGGIAGIVVLFGVGYVVDWIFSGAGAFAILAFEPYMILTVISCVGAGITTGIIAKRNGWKHGALTGAVISVAVVISAAIEGFSSEHIDIQIIVSAFTILGIIVLCALGCNAGIWFTGRNRW